MNESWWEVPAQQAHLKAIVHETVQHLAPEELDDFDGLFAEFIADLRLWE